MSGSGKESMSTVKERNVTGAKAKSRQASLIGQSGQLASGRTIVIRTRRKTTSDIFRHGHRSRRRNHGKFGAIDNRDIPVNSFLLLLLLFLLLLFFFFFF